MGLKLHNTFQIQKCYKYFTFSSKEFKHTLKQEKITWEAKNAYIFYYFVLFLNILNYLLLQIYINYGLTF